jgi:hypothetical protein
MMDTNTLLTDIKARFNHNSAKAYLTEKYNAKLIVADQGGLWRADLQTISFLSSSINMYLVIIDTFGNPVKVGRQELLEVLENTYNNVMEEWHQEWQELETKR